MKWQTEQARGWVRKFAWTPLTIGDQWIWWEHYERRVTHETEVGPSYEYRMPEVAR